MDDEDEYGAMIEQPGERAEDEEYGEMVELPEEESDVEDTDDGGAIVRLGEEEEQRSDDFYANLAEGKPQAAFALCSGDIEWNEAESNPLADRNPYRGASQIAEGVFGRLGAIFEGFAAVPDEFIAESGRVIVIARYHGTHRKSGAKLYCQAVHSWWVDGGKIVRFQQYTDTLQWARATEA